MHNNAIKTPPVERHCPPWRNHAYRVFNIGLITDDVIVQYFESTTDPKRNLCSAPGLPSHCR
eukprot:1196234-Prorocentrum_minimum.AAC.2